MRWVQVLLVFFFFFNDTATTEIYTLSLHDALPIWSGGRWPSMSPSAARRALPSRRSRPRRDRKSTRLNSSHGYISYAVFCLKKKKEMSRLLGEYETLVTTLHARDSALDATDMRHGR